MTTLAEDLLAQAEVLAALDPSRPKEASLRRAVSTAYYSLFHLLLDSFEQQFAPGLRRAVDHSAIARASRIVKESFDVQQNNPQAYRPVAPLKEITISAELRSVAATVLDLQIARIQADYDVRASYTRRDTQQILASCRAAHVTWAQRRGKPDARAYLCMFLVDPDKLKERA
ncbi:MAG TPA: hypothetical protein VIK91_24165 [Nannocystis sp.]